MDKSSLRKKLRNLLLVIALGSGLILSALYYWRSKSVFRLGGSSDSPPVAVLFNPFRDRSPEHTADRWLNASRTGLASGGVVAVDSALCGATNGTVDRWKLESRTDIPQQEMTFLSYRVRCSNGDRYLFVNAKRANGDWRITDWRSSEPFENLNEKIK